MNDKSKSINSTETKLRRITELSGGSPVQVFNCLMPHFNRESLTACFHELDGSKAVGIDRKTKEEYGNNLDSNIGRLIERMKSMVYLPEPVREVLIPKEDGKNRPLGISNFEDKIVQLMMSKVLEAIYEPRFHNFSFGFRRGRSCHQAIKACHNHLYKYRTEVVFDADLQNFFGTICHKKLVKLLEMKIKDRRFIRYVVRMLKAGVLANGELKRSDEGTPQGSIVSPVLANIFAHYAYDTWFEEIVRPRVSPQTAMFRYADDLVICCMEDDVERIIKSFKGRTDRFSLVINETKSRVVSFDKKKFEEGRQGTFDFLGFTFYLGRARNGRTILPKVMTSKKRFRKKLRVVKDWCKANRSKGKLEELWKRFRIKLAGHIRYYGVSFNQEGIKQFSNQSSKIFFTWMNRRSQRKSFDWDKFNRFMEVRPPPPIRIYHSLFAI